MYLIFRVFSVIYKVRKKFKKIHLNIQNINERKLFDSLDLFENIVIDMLSDYIS